MPNTDVRYYCGNDKSDVTGLVLAACGEPAIPVPIANVEATIGKRGQVSGSTTVVRVQCKAEQWCDFHCGTAPPDQNVTGVPVPNNEVAQFEAWQKYADPLEGMKRLDTYSTWLFTAHGFVILLV